jgi:hypothetical protein
MKRNITIVEQKQRAGALSLKEFYSLSTEQSNSYILELFEVPIEERTSLDKFILKYFSLKPVQTVEEYFIDF